ALGVAVSITPDFPSGAALTTKRIVPWHHAIRADANNLALQVIQLLSGGRLIVLTQSDIQVPTTRIESHAHTVVLPGRQGGLLTEYGTKGVQPCQVGRQDPETHVGG